MATVTLIGVNDVVYELGIRSLTAYLRREGHSVQLVFVNEPDSELTDVDLAEVAAIADGSDLIGISLLSHSFRKAVRLTQVLRAHHPSIPILWGGIHASGFPDACLEVADLVCLGEGEQMLSELATCLEAGDSYESLDNLCYKDAAGTVHRNPVRPPIPDLDSLPFQDYSLVDEHILLGGRLVPMDAEVLREHLLYYPFPGMGHVYVTMASRGCPFNCSFCCNNVWHSLYKRGAQVRKRSVEHVIGEIEDVVARFPFIQVILLEDDSFLVRSTEEIREFADAYRVRVGLPFSIQMNPNEVSFEKLEALKNAGLGHMHIGIQSGDEQIRRTFYKRFTSDEKIAETNRVLSELDILHKYDIIVDTPFPGDEKASFEMIRRFKGRFAINLYSLRVYPGLAIEGIMRDAGYSEWLDENDTSVDYFTIASDAAYSFALKRYLPFPPSRKSKALAKLVSAWPRGAYWAYTHLGGKHLFNAYRRARLAQMRLKDGSADAQDATRSG